MTTKERLDIHQAVTDTILAALEAGAGEASLPWHRTGACSILPRNAVTGDAYNGINVLALWATAEARQYAKSRWATYKQWQSIGAQVRKGEKAALVVFYKQYETDPNPEDETDDGLRRVAKASWVFNAAQVDGVEIDEAPSVLPPIDRLERAEALIRAAKADIRIGGENAYYARRGDYIQMPDEHLFRAQGYQRTEDWYSVELHELAHWSGAESRLNREFGKRFGDEAYAMEELCALSGQSGCGLSGQSGATRSDL